MAKTLITAWFSKDEQSRGKYLQASEKIFLAHGMTGATLYGSDSTIVGEMNPDAVVMVEWGDAEQCKQAFQSSEYQDLISFREKGFDKIDITLLAE